jgi:hypothetical protein
LRDCLTADEEFGEAWVYERDKQGRFIIDNYGEDLKVKCLKAEVKLTSLTSV